MGRGGGDLEAEGELARHDSMGGCETTILGLGMGGACILRGEGGRASCAGRAGVEASCAVWMRKRSEERALFCRGSRCATGLLRVSKRVKSRRNATTHTACLRWKSIILSAISVGCAGSRSLPFLDARGTILVGDSGMMGKGKTEAERCCRAE